MVVETVNHVPVVSKAALVINATHAFFFFIIIIFIIILRMQNVPSIYIYLLVTSLSMHSLSCTSYRTPL